MPFSLRQVPGPIRAAFVAIVLLALGGAYDALVADTQLVDLQAEVDDGFSLPPLFSGALLLGAAVYAALLAARTDGRGPPRWVWWIWGAFFLEATLDETVTIHEHIGTALGVDWMIVYSPLFLVAGVMFVVVLRGLAGRPERWLWLAGAAWWVFSQMLEVYAFGGRPDDDPRPGAGVTGAVEELGEMLGSTFLLWTVLSLYRRLGETGSLTRSRPPSRRWRIR